MRGRYEGALNVVRFNWPKYVMGITVIVGLILLLMFTHGQTSTVIGLLLVLALLAILIPLGVSHIVYDRSALYRMEWLDTIDIGRNGILLNINAGFDETTVLVRERFPGCTLLALDFYDPERHTEPSIERARKFADRPIRSIPITTSLLPFDTGSVDAVLCFLSLHEVRDPQERLRFLTEIHRVLKPDGKLIVTEHLRDAANFIAFNFGFLHFHSRSTWNKAFQQTGFLTGELVPTTPFVTTYVLMPS